MEIGIIARTFEEPTLAGVLDAVAAHGIRRVQFNVSCMGVYDFPNGPDAARLCAGAPRVGRPHDRGSLPLRDLQHDSPRSGCARTGMPWLRLRAEHAADLGTDLLTLCTGTRDPHNMWADHPQNGSPEAWSDLLTAMEKALAIAEEHGVRLGIEPEVSNVVSSPHKARELLETMRSDRLAIVMDGANVFPRGTIQRQRQILDEAFDLLGDRIALAHAQRPVPRRRGRP